MIKENYAHNRKRKFLEGIDSKDISYKKDVNHPYKLYEWDKNLYISKNLYHDLTIDEQMEKQQVRRHGGEVFLENINYNFCDNYPSPEEQILIEENKESIMFFYNNILNEFERKIVMQRYNGLSNREIAKKNKFSHTYINNSFKIIKNKYLSYTK